MKILLIRHGETDANVVGMLHGRTDSDLNANGIIQSNKLSKYLLNEDIDFIYSSDLKRAVDTVKGISIFKDIPIILSQELRERNLGPREGLLISQVRGKNEPLGVESSEMVLKRLLKFICDIYKDKSDKTVIMMTHGRVIKILVSYILFGNVEFLNSVEEQKNTAINIIFFDGNIFRIDKMNHFDHLTESF